ncbi:MAG TPA: hypothetical protein VLJ86_20720 [Ramlibacter sp.]|nr:hypothetical protein [Ramlibacter sp.]
MATLLLAGCATSVLQGADAAAPLFRDPRLGVEDALRVIEVGRSDKREVEERLGPAERLAFDSGFEVWVYRPREQPRGAEPAELVILFDPQQKVSKLRARPAYPRTGSKQR